MESTDSSSGSQHPQLPPGFRFHPTDEELVVHYLKRKAASAPLPVTIIAEVDLYKFDPWELPSKATFGEQEWYFFSPRDRKYPNGARPNRAATSGYWKATGTDKPILTSNGTQNQKVGVKKALVFYGGKPPKGIKTNWIMHEYRLIDTNFASKPPMATDPGNKKGSLRLDDWVLCRIYKKNNGNRPMEIREKEDLMEDHQILVSTSVMNGHSIQNLAPARVSNYGAPLMEQEENFFEGILIAGGLQNSSSMPHLASPSTKTDVSMASSSLPAKRNLQTQYWNETTSFGSSPVKRFHGDHLHHVGSGTGGNSSSFVSLLTQLPPDTAGFHHNPRGGAFGDGVLRQPYQLPSMNWDL